MNRAMGQRDDNGDRPHIDSIESNIRAIYFQLQSARASLTRLFPDEICLAIMDDCLASFKAQHNPREPEANESILWEETSMEALLRLFEYLHAEIDEGLHDRPSAKQLKLCMARLTQILLL
jgi:hypothetical protein